MLNFNYRDPRPLYQQLKENLRQMIISGALKTDEKLPSVRELAASLAINPNTIQRAYRELESEGYVYSVSGRGTFVSEVTDETRKRIEELIGQLDAVVEELLFLSFSPENIKEHIQELAERGTKNND